MNLWLAFIAVATVDIVTPGPAIVLAVNNGAVHGVRRTLWSTFGNELGLLTHGVVGGIGVAAVLETMPGLLLAMQVVGTAYLVWLGVTRLRRAGAAVDTQASIATATGSLVRTGFGTAALNPRPFLFFAALLPQFVHPARPFGVQVAAMIATFLAISFASLSLYSVLGSRIGALPNGDRVRRWLTKISGVAFLAFAVHFSGLV